MHVTLPKDLAGKISELEKSLPGLAYALGPYYWHSEIPSSEDSLGGSEEQWDVYPEDVACIETDAYVVSAALMRKEYGSTGPCREEKFWRYIHFYYILKTEPGSALQVQTEPICIEDKHDSKAGFPQLKEYRSLTLRVAQEDEIDAAWADGRGNTGPRYRLHLTRKTCTPQLAL